jgi:hypothetical protein
MSEIGSASLTGIFQAWRADSLRPVADWRDRVAPGTAATWQMQIRRTASSAGGCQAVRASGTVLVRPGRPGLGESCAGQLPRSGPGTDRRRRQAQLMPSPKLSVANGAICMASIRHCCNSATENERHRRRPCSPTSTRRRRIRARTARGELTTLCNQRRAWLCGRISAVSSARSLSAAQTPRSVVVVDKPASRLPAILTYLVAADPDGGG